MSGGAWQASRGVIVLTALPEALKEPYQIFKTLPLEDQQRISSVIMIFMTKCPQMGKQTAFELVYKLGLYMAKRGKKL